MTQVSFVRTEMLPEKAPPPTSVGIIGWLRANLFSSWVNGILTVVALFFIYRLLSSVLPWALVPTGSGTSLGNCREILHGMGREGHFAGACWGVINERWLQIFFGFYPSEFYWRPILAFVGLLLALSPILYPERAFKLITFSALYPFLAVWLIWGGSFWVPLLVLAGFVLGYYAFSFAVARLNQIVALILAVLVPVVWWFVLMGPIDSTLAKWVTNSRVNTAVEQLTLELEDESLGVAKRKFLEEQLGAFKRLPDAQANLEAAQDAEATSEAQNQLSAIYKTTGLVGLVPVESANIGGFMLAFIIGVTGITASLPIGVVLALGRQSDLIILKGICVGFIEFIRGVPLITLLFVASTLLNIFMPPGTNFDLVLRVIIMVTLFSSAYMAEVIRGGLAALPKGQYEAADSLGLDYWQAQRLIIMPQALKISIPGIVGNFIGLFKDTTLVSVIALWDPILLSTNIRADAAWNGILWELYGFIALIFFIVCFSMSRYSMYLERKLATDHR
ncbi:MAG: amino acid ABC transporter permease [Pseudomonadota bacterium]